MGLLRFLVTSPDDLNDQAIEQAYMMGLEHVPWPGHVRRSGNEIALERRISDSGTFSIPWRVEGHGWVTLSTGCLIERPSPYYLPLELARGKLAHVRNQLAEWLAAGLIAPDAVGKQIAEAVVHLSRAATTDPNSEDSRAAAQQALHAACDAAILLAGCYVDQALAVRRHSPQPRPGFLGADLGLSILDESAAAQFLKTFDAANVPMVWRDIETSEGRRRWATPNRQVRWCRTHHLTVCAGPLLDLDARALPDWIYLCEGDVDSLQSFIAEYIQDAVTRYRGEVDLWQCAGRSNTAKVLSLTEEECLQLTANAIELVRSLDPHTPVVVSLDQPWSEYTSHQQTDFSAMHFADALARAGLGLSGVMLELNLGYSPGGTLPRDLLDLSRQLDRWSLLGMPLYISLCLPSSDQPDPQAQRNSHLLPGEYTNATQRTAVHRIVSMLLAKPMVQGILWRQLHDAEPHEFPHGGLFDARRHAKPALRALASLRQSHLLKKP